MHVMRYITGNTTVNITGNITWIHWKSI